MLSRKRVLLRSALKASLANTVPSPPSDYSSIAVPAFDLKGYAIPQLKLRMLDREELQHPLIPFDSSSANIFGSDLLYGTSSVVPSLAVFRDLFDAFTHDFFQDFDLQGSMIAGGSVLGCLLPIPTTMRRLYKLHREYTFTLKKLPLPKDILEHINSFMGKDTDLEKFKWHARSRFYDAEPFKKSDVDIFILANTLEEAKVKLEKLYNSITRKYEKMGKYYLVVRTANAVTICSEYPYRHIQLIIAPLRTKDEFLLFCDMDCTSCLYDGQQVHVSPRSIHALNTRCNIVPPNAFLSRVDNARMVKYVNRGFSALVFELCKHEVRCDVILRKQVRAAVVALETKEGQQETMRDRAQYVDVRLPFGPRIGIEDIYEAANAYKACIVGNTLQDVMEKEKRKEREKEGAGEGDKLKGIRWKLFDTIENRSSDDILPRCYTCKQRFMPATIDQVGLSLCTECMKEDVRMLERWDSLTDLDDCVALVTGARIKIGYQTALRLLRSGVTVIGVTRFPNDAARRYSLEEDYSIWKHKLHIYGVDLRHLPSVSEFIGHILKSYTRIDILINNAAQTIRRPVAYYRTLIEQEAKLHSSNEFSAKFLVKGVNQDPFLIENYKHKKSNDEETELAVGNSIHGGVMMLSVGSPTDMSLPKSAALSQAKLLPMDMVDRDDVAFPPGKFDSHNEPLDTRHHTSWTQTIEEVSPVELMEVQTVNSTVPFMFISTLTPLLKNATVVSRHRRSFVVNVTSAEGIFNMNKRGIHPHTNMAKAALNMMTKSIATSFAAINIFVTAVDTGWITKMKPEEGMGGRSEGGATPAPLQDKDGAARILHPVYEGYSRRSRRGAVGPSLYGVLIQNYKVIPWT